jgi:hypothetical protein
MPDKGRIGLREAAVLALRTSPLALTRPYGRFKLHPAPSGNVLDKYAGLAPDQTPRIQPGRMTGTTCPASTGKSPEIPVQPFAQKYSA